jgi:hypothetical protein
VELRTAAAASIVATTLAGSCFGQGLGEAAERERQRRAASSPPAVGELVPGTTRWAGTIRTQGQTHAAGLVTEVREGRVTGRRGTDAFGPFPASSTPLSIEVGVPLFGGAGIPQVVASLPLVQGYEARLWDLVLQP